MTDPNRVTVRVGVPKVDNVIDMGELLRALRDFAGREAGPSPADTPGAAARADDLGRVHDLAAELAELIERIPDFPRPGRRSAGSPQP